MMLKFWLTCSVLMSVSSFSYLEVVSADLKTDYQALEEIINAKKLFQIDSIKGWLQKQDSICKTIKRKIACDGNARQDQINGANKFIDFNKSLENGSIKTSCNRETRLEIENHVEAARSCPNLMELLEKSLKDHLIRCSEELVQEAIGAMIMLKKSSPLSYETIIEIGNVLFPLYFKFNDRYDKQRDALGYANYKTYEMYIRDLEFKPEINYGPAMLDVLQLARGHVKRENSIAKFEPLRTKSAIIKAYDEFIVRSCLILMDHINESPGFDLFKFMSDKIGLDREFFKIKSDFNSESTNLFFEVWQDQEFCKRLVIAKREELYEQVWEALKARDAKLVEVFS